MELKVKEKEKIEYPKMEQIGTKKLKKCNLTKWKKVGITSFMLGVMLQKNAFATSSIEGLIEGLEVEEVELDGGTTVIAEELIDYIVPICMVAISAVIIIACIINIIYIKVKYKDKEHKIKKVTKVLLIIFSVLLIIGVFWELYFGELWLEIF